MQSSATTADVPVAVTTVDSRTYRIDRAVEPVRWLFRWGSLAMLIAMVSLPFIQVVSREIFATPIIGVEELARFMLICAVFLALPYVISAGANIRMEEIVSMLPGSVVHMAKILGAIAATATFAAITIASFVAIGGNLDNSTPTLGIPYWIFLGAAGISFAMSTLECAIQTAKAIQGRPLYVTFPQEHEPEDELDLPDEMKH
ncbi:MAG: TRAP transporter small permease subunit [Bosea sp. (in: a-proteobacteria)]|uniref:TRAP transporter small permease n=1 Tax=Bosea sp. (in: a-proteobacteria) TaxID=1871050 RepID=UPI0027342772|nr:TRAP transporter small permease subunit [Bosea sp. (in: a-proteobacteria)]MDP3256182.1 TRAP transporter small permease subunit [Bosea sp. (in: a-proteobacteria)]MDP3318806.1 TRAP transporter small permease subunit [Bosea sp. (in: a-proteobacteria)]